MTVPTSTYRGRIAPSPTGLLHLGHARTFWIAQQRAQASQGVLVFRNEDLDHSRRKDEFVKAMFEDLDWFGIRWQEGPDFGGPFGPYVQSERTTFYQAAFDKLRAGGFVYPCSCSRQDVLRALQAPHAGDDEPIYPGTCRPVRLNLQQPPGHPSGMSLPPAPDRDVPLESSVPPHGRDVPLESGIPPRGRDVPLGRPPPLPPKPHAPDSSVRVNWRFQVPDGETVTFVDGRYGPQSFVAGNDFGDFVVWRHDGIPSYQLAVVVDDATMQITEVVRGADLLKSTARQLLLYRALGLPAPAFYHCPLVTDSSGVRLAKRHDALSLRALRASGTSPEALRAEWESRAER